MHNGETYFGTREDALTFYAGGDESKLHRFVVKPGGLKIIKIANAANGIKLVKALNSVNGVWDRETGEDREARGICSFFGQAAIPL